VSAAVEIAPTDKQQRGAERDRGHSVTHEASPSLTERNKNGQAVAVDRGPDERGLDEDAHFDSRLYDKPPDP
jgi:hypothetical protein